MKLKKTNKVFGLLAVAAFGFGSAASQAALIDRGGGLIYDDVLNVTWLQDAQLRGDHGSAPFGSLSGRKHRLGLRPRVLRHRARRRLGRLAPAERPSMRRALGLGHDRPDQRAGVHVLRQPRLRAGFRAHPDDPFPTGAGYNPFINIVIAATGPIRRSHRIAGRGPGTCTCISATGRSRTERLPKVWGVRDGDVGLPPSPRCRYREASDLFAAAMGLAAFMRRRKPLAI